MLQFCDLLSKLKNKNEIKNFLKDLLNRQERMMIIRRLLIAEMLKDNKSYVEIRKALKCGTATIARVQRWLNFGRGGYEKVIKIKKKK